jgi:hypothetical protein
LLACHIASRPTPSNYLIKEFNASIFSTPRWHFASTPPIKEGKTYLWLVGVRNNPIDGSMPALAPKISSSWIFARAASNSPNVLEFLWKCAFRCLLLQRSWPLRPTSTRRFVPTFALVCSAFSSPDLQFSEA